jgi:hypothetical protein
MGRGGSGRPASRRHAATRLDDAIERLQASSRRFLGASCLTPALVSFAGRAPSSSDAVVA